MSFLLSSWAKKMVLRHIMMNPKQPFHTLCTCYHAGCTLSTTFPLIHFKRKYKTGETDEQGGGQLGVCININISTPSVPHPLPPFSNPLCACVCFSLTTSGCMYNGSYEPRCLLFLSPVPLHQLSVAWSAWLPGLVGCLLRLAGPACLSAPRLVSPALRRRRGWECHSTKAAWVELCKQ